MKYSIAVLFMSCITAATCEDCFWSACEGLTIKGKDICARTEGYFYTGETAKSDCGLITEKVKCCKDLTKDCFWSACEGLTVTGQEVCGRTEKYFYSGATKKDDCGWDTEKVQCCKDVGHGCKWSRLCYGIAYGHSYVCQHEFTPSYKPGGKKSCSGLGMTAYECCLD
ncbi:hypothetical protein Bhyg_14391 [Pseudolycoriella hygida]|uniref:Uncharacterized protein n=1 Tax=Pseudolycoriella hygida TaxID=35572 RepID=A0A9Q0MRH9_9DIPT|nr:hypothetical protein Bhyg_14391 [Pseudolycoriella hygida]